MGYGVWGMEYEECTMRWSLGSIVGHRAEVGVRDDNIIL